METQSAPNRDEEPDIVHASGDQWFAWWARLFRTVAAMALAVAAILFDRLGRNGGPGWYRDALEWAASLWPWDLSVVRSVDDSIPSGLLSLLALVLLILPISSWAFLELPTPLASKRNSVRMPNELLRWLRDFILLIAVVAASVALAQLPGAAGVSVELTNTTPATSTSPSSSMPEESTTTTNTTTATAAGEPRSRPAIGTLLRFLLAIPLASIILKLLLLRRYALIARAKHTPVALQDLLDTQRKDLSQLAGLITGQRLHEPSRIVRFTGRWGDGKSYILRRLETHLEAHNVSGQAVAYVDVWKHEAEPTLHLAIFEELLSTPCYLRGGGWMHYPLTLVPGRYLSGGIAKISLKIKSGSGAEVPVALPALPWQRHTERLVARQRRQGNRTVIVLDEIDRAAPIMAQTAITLALRSLDLPGVVVVLSCVKDVLRYKAFNPSVEAGLPDLGSTIDASLFVAQFERDPPALGRIPANPSLHTWWPSYAPDASKDAPSDQRPHLTTVQERLHRGFEGVDAATRLALQGQFEERYLGRVGVDVHPLSLEDAAAIAVTFPGLISDALRVAGVASDAPQQAIERVKAEVRIALEALVDGRGNRDSVPPVRVFESELGTILLAQVFALDRSEHEGDPALLAACVQLAFELATYRVSLTR